MMKRRAAANRASLMEVDSEGDSGFVTPDSTTGCGYTDSCKRNERSDACKRNERSGHFFVGEEVLSHSKDGRFYLGNIVEIDETSHKCLVQFADNTAHWSLFKDIRALRVPDSDELCRVCKSSKSTQSNEIVLCSQCQLGYHQKCMQPHISSKFTEPDSDWRCPECCDHRKNNSQSITTHNNNIKDKQKNKTEQPKKNKKRLKKNNSSSQTKDDDLDNKQKLPYDIKSLHWDPGHKMNTEQTYCYCGGPGEWYNRMLQCHRCRQWFHEACLDSLHYPLLYGDRFYVFACNLCNSSAGEFVFRLNVCWVDVVHLAMFNLTLHDVKTYFDYDEAITHWININWELLQAPLEMQNVCVEDRKEEVLRVLESSKQRFKCGKEVRRRPCMWGLRSRVPPPVPLFKLPADVPINEKLVLRYYKQTDSGGTCINSPPIPRFIRLRDDSKSDESHSSINPYSPCKKRALSPLQPPTTSMIQHLNKQQENRYKPPPPPKPPPEETPQEESKDKVKRRRKGELDKLLDDKKASKMLEEMYSTTVHDSDNRVKRSRSGTNLKTYNTSGELQKVSTDPIAVTMKTESSPSLSSDDTVSDDTSSSHGTLDSFIPPPSNFEGQNNPFVTLDLLNSSLANSKVNKRKLQESDIRIGKNGEIKRRLYRKKRGYTFNATSESQTSNNTSNYYYKNGMRLYRDTEQTNNDNNNEDSVIKNCLDYALNARLTGEGKEDLQRRSSVTDSKVSFDDLKSTVNNYFGAANRIANGEPFNILAKRICLERVQYLIEWNCSSTSAAPS